MIYRLYNITTLKMDLYALFYYNNKSFASPVSSVTSFLLSIHSGCMILYNNILYKWNVLVFYKAGSVALSCIPVVFGLDILYGHCTGFMLCALCFISHQIIFSYLCHPLLTDGFYYLAKITSVGRRSGTV